MSMPSLIADFISLSFNGGTTVVEFSNFEIRRDVQYVPDEAPQTYVSESGISFAQARKQAEYFEFRLRIERPETRKKWEQIRKVITNQYTLSATLKNFIAPFTDFTFTTENNDTQGDLDGFNVAFDANFPNAVIELPQDYAMDRMARGNAATRVLDTTIRIYKSNAPAPPPSPCSQVSVADFVYNQWQLDGSNNELLQIDVAIEALGLVQSIDTYNAGLVEVLAGATVDSMTWNGTEYVPDNGPNILTEGVVYVFTANLGITLKSGDTCSFTYTQQFTAPAIANQAPVASALAVAVTGGGPVKQGAPLTLSYTYTDNEGDVEGATVIQLFSYDTYTDEFTNTGETLLISSNTYTPGPGDIGKILVWKVTPVAATGTTTGATQVLQVDGGLPIITNNVAFTLDTTKDTAFTINIAVASGEPYIIDWGDGTWTRANGTGAGVAHANTWTPQVAARTVTFCMPNNALQRLSAITQEITGAVDLSNLTGINADILLSDNAITSFTQPAGGSVTTLWLQSNNITGTLDISGTPFNSTTEFRLQSNDFDTVNLPTANTVDVTRFYLNTNNNIASIDLSGFDSITGDIRIHDNPALTNITWKATNTATTPFTTSYIFNNPLLTSVWDFSGWGTGIWGGEIQWTNNALGNITPPAGSATILTLWLHINQMTDITLDNLTFSTSAEFRGNNNTGLVTFSAAGLTGSFNRFQLNNTAVGPAFVAQVNNIVMQTAFNQLRLDSSGAASGDLDAILAAWEATYNTAGSGTFNIAGTNPAPGAAGNASIVNITGQGYTVTSN